MAGYKMIGGDPPKLRVVEAAAFLRSIATRLKSAARRQMRWHWRIWRGAALHRHSSEERNRIRVQRLPAERFRWSDLAQPSTIHHTHAVTDVPDNRKIMRNEKECHAELCSQLPEQRDYLLADERIQRGYRFVADDESWIER
jgi:hypothetical protein